MAMVIGKDLVLYPYNDIDFTQNGFNYIGQIIDLWVKSLANLKFSREIFLKVKMARTREADTSSCEMREHKKSRALRKQPWRPIGLM